MANGCEHGLPFTKSAPFPKMAVDCVPTQHNIAEEMTHRQLMPLTTALELMENRIYDLYKTSLGDIFSFRLTIIFLNYCTKAAFALYLRLCYAPMAPVGA